MKPSNISKAQMEVWQWKEKLSQEIENMVFDERLEYLLKKSQKSASLLRSKKFPIGAFFDAHKSLLV